MKKSSLFFALPLFLLAASCAKEPFMEVNADPNLIPLNIAGSINQQHTKATADGFVDKDAIGLYAVNYTDNNTVAGTLQVSGNQADNVKYVFDETSHKWTPVKSVYYKDVNTNVDIYLYYPYQASISNMTAGNFEVSKDQSSEKTATSLSGYEASDFLWGKKAGVVPSEASVGVKLSHKMAAVKVTLNEGTGFGPDEFEGLPKSVILVNTTRKATIDYTTGTVTKLGDPQLDGIVMCPQNDGSFRAIVVPQSVAAGTNLFAITIGGISYGFSQNAAVEYMSGKQLNANITINKADGTGVELVAGDWQITDWTEDLNTHGGEARQYFVVNVSEPGTLGKTIKAMGKNPDKIKNLKVVGNVRDDDFYFMRDSMAILEAINMKESEVAPTGNQIASIWKEDQTLQYCLLKYGDTYTLEGEWYIWYDNGHSIPASAFNGKTKLCYYVFPDNVTSIGESAFYHTSISGTMIIPDDVLFIGDNAFEGTNISSVSFNPKLVSIGSSAFRNCKSLQGNLVLPQSLRYIDSYAFCNIGGFSGKLMLPNVGYLGCEVFRESGNFTGDLVIPASISKLYSLAFYGTRFSGSLIFEGDIELLTGTSYSDPNSSSYYTGEHFYDCGFSGDLVLPEGLINIPFRSFYGNNFLSIVFPESIRTVGEAAFSSNPTLQNLYLKEGIVSISDYAFTGCSSLLGLDIPSTVETIGSNAFSGCSYISSIHCSAIEPPTIRDNTFTGVAKDNFVIEVPEQSIVRYQTEVGWSDFKRITAHYDFSIGRTRMRALNARMQRTYTLRCPAGNSWSVSDKPDWISVEPSSGTGKTDVTITISEMPRTNDEFEVNVASFQYPEYRNYKGRKGTVTFSLSGKDYTCELAIEQYDYDKADGEIITHQTHSTANGIDIVFIGEGYDAKDITDGKFERDCENGFIHFFDIEPYKTYKDYFNVYSVLSQSDESGIETVNTIIANKFIENGNIDVNAALSWAKKADNNIDLSKSVVILLENNSSYYGWTSMYADGTALSIVPVSEEAYPYDFRGLIQHEAGGHAFGKLGDEYIYHNAYIPTCECPCCDHPSYEYDVNTQFGFFKTLGWFKNLSRYSDHTQVPWSHLIFHPTFSNRVDMYEGAYMHTRGMYRSEITSCMNNNIPYFNTISRQAIVERIKEYAGETFDFDDFVAKDNFDVGTKASMQNFDWTFGVDPKWNRGTEHGSIIYMGEHPNVK